MKSVKLEKGIYKKIGENTYHGSGTTLVLVLNEPDSFWMYRFLSGNKDAPCFKLSRTQNRDVFGIDYKEKELFLGIYQDKVEVISV